MTADTVLRGGTVIDGTGAPARNADVAITGGVVSAIGADLGSDADGARVVDVSGLVVSPGFIDIHTHYDAQVFWDRMLTISPWHGVTTVVIGNCGLPGTKMVPAAHATDCAGSIRIPAAACGLVGLKPGRRRCQ